MTTMALAKRIIQVEEGFRATPYYCTQGFPTIGWGKVIGEKGAPLPSITITQAEAESDLNKFLLTAIKELSTHKDLKPVFESLVKDPDRGAVLVSMWYQLGSRKLAGFKNTLSAILDKDWTEVAREMLNSDAARQTPKRWKRQSTAMLAGSVASAYNV